ncbi:MAG: pyruvate dehydrogenase complex dihydrolipoamide acetyltransferase [Rhodospirillales bacterium]|nr:pyruvate dehydrogenase complex dihydrolipoamide acetyltransferase [Rhodospirillales bacterium]
MPIPILMPALSPTMTEGRLARWLKSEGDDVAAGDVVAEIETDKATMEVEAVDEGVLGRILVPAETDGVAVNTPIALILEEGEDPAALDAAPAPRQEPGPTAQEPETAEPEAMPAAKAVPAEAPTPQAGRGSRIFASPLARRMVAEAGLDLARIGGSGPNGRVIKRDVEAAITAGTAKPAAEAAPEPGAARQAAGEALGAPATPGKAAPAKPAPQLPETGRPYRDVPHTTMRKVIAERLTASKRDIPHYYLTIDCNVDALIELRDQLNSSSSTGEGAYKLSLNDFIIRAAATALRRHPACNSAWGDNALRLYEAVDISVAVATPNGLITPIVRDADRKGLAGISSEVRALAVKARDGKLAPEEYQGGGFTISNLGMYGIREFAAIINPPQTCLLAVGVAEPRPVVKDGALTIATIMTCTLSADHRAVDGAVGAEFLAALKKLLEQPLTMLL